MDKQDLKAPSDQHAEQIVEQKPDDPNVTLEGQTVKRDADAETQKNDTDDQKGKS